MCEDCQRLGEMCPICEYITSEILLLPKKEEEPPPIETEHEPCGCAQEQ